MVCKCIKVDQTIWCIVAWLFFTFFFTRVVYGWFFSVGGRQFSIVTKINMESPQCLWQLPCEWVCSNSSNLVVIPYWEPPFFFCLNELIRIKTYTRWFHLWRDVKAHSLGGSLLSDSSFLSGTSQTLYDIITKPGQVQGLSYWLTILCICLWSLIYRKIVIFFLVFVCLFALHVHLFVHMVMPPCKIQFPLMFSVCR